MYALLVAIAAIVIALLLDAYVDRSDLVSPSPPTEARDFPGFGDTGTDCPPARVPPAVKPFAQPGRAGSGPENPHLSLVGYRDPWTVASLATQHTRR